MIAILILSILLAVGCLAGTIYYAIQREWAPVPFLLMFSVLWSILTCVICGVIADGNVETVEYSFPASHYDLREEVTITRTMDGNGVIKETTDTVYVITGEEPIMLNDKHYKTKSIKYE